MVKKFATKTTRQQQIYRKKLNTNTNLHLHQTKVSSIFWTLLLLYNIVLCLETIDVVFCFGQYGMNENNQLESF